MTSRHLTTVLVLAMFLFAAATSVYAVSGRTRRVEGPELLKGDMKNLYTTSKGELRLNFKMEKVESKALSLWCSAMDTKGTPYFGTGLKAEIYKLEEGKLVIIDIGDKYLADMVVSTMACDGDDNLYAAFLPSGRIVRVTPEGKAEEFANLPEFYIWQIVFDGNGGMYVATGPAGRIYHIGADGAKKVVYDSDEDNIVSMAFDNTGDLYFGTSPGAILMKITATELKKEKPAAKVVYDFPMTDVRSMDFQDGVLYVGVNKIGGGGASYDYSDEFGESYRAEGEMPIEAFLMGYEGGIVFRVDDRGDVEGLYNSRNPVTQIRIAGDDLYIAAAGENRIYKYDTGKREQSYFKIEEKQAHTFELNKGRLSVIGTTDPGVIYRVDDRPVQEGVFTSDVLDAGTTVQRWGTLKWESDGELIFQTRSGDTEKPDSTWSDWSEEIKESSSAIKSPHARFIQFRVTWAHPEASLKNVDLSYVTRNIRPVITGIIVGKPTSEGLDSDYSDMRMSNDEKKPGLPVMWQAADPNGDALEFDVFYKGEKETRWKKANHDDPVPGPAFPLNPDLLPSGKYRVKVIASDKPSNPEGDHLTRELISDVFTIDHDGPAIGELSAQSVKKGISTVTGSLSDEISDIRRVEYSLDGMEWKAGTCEDGIFDNQTEELKIILEDAAPGEHTIVVRAYDDRDNMTAAHLTFTIK
ncbi:MAG: hypothetical protein ABIH04_10170 [Planctomycetota bacterium]